MDKGVKGLLSGDLSSPIIMQIQNSIQHFKHSFESISQQIEDLLEKKTTLEGFYNENFMLIQENPYKKNAPGYETLQSMQNFFVVMERKDWQKHIQLKNKNTYTSSSAAAPESLISADMLQQNNNQHKKQQQSVQFDDPKNLLAFLKNKMH